MKSYMCLFTLLIYLFAGIEGASAADGLPFKRILAVNEWGGQFSTKANIDQAINDAVYMNVDAIMMQVGSEYFEAVRNTSRASWDSRASWNMLEYAINKAHYKNIQVHVWITVNNANSPIRAERKMWGTKYNTVNVNGGKSSRLEIANPIVANYEADLLGFIAKHYPTLDGIMVEEPFYVTQSYSPEIIARVKEKFNGYNIAGKNDQANVLCRGSSMKGTDHSICPTYAKIYDVERDAFNEFFTKLSSYVNTNKSNPNLLLSAGAANGYRPLHGFDPGYMSNNYLIDWYISQTGAKSLSNFKSSIEGVKLQVKNIPNVPVSAITYTSIYPDVNPLFLQQMTKSCEYGADAEMVFAYGWKNKIFNGITAYEGMHNLPPSSLCNQATIVSASAFSPPEGTYDSSQTVSISTSTPGAIIRYTKDGTTPTETSSIYTMPIPISSTTTLKARAWKIGFSPSATTMATYTISTLVLSSITISPKSVSMDVGSTQAFTADPKDQNGNPITTTVTWTSSNESAGTISNSGIFTALTDGTAIITAGSGSVSGTAEVVITALGDVILDEVISPGLPLITTPPESQNVIVGESVTFGVIVTNTDNLSYQWQKNGVDIPGETDVSYTVPGTTPQDNGSTYRVIVTNPAGSVISEDATLFLISLPNLITNPGFENGMTSWIFYTNGSGTFDVLSPGYEGNNAAILALNRVGSNTQLYQKGIVLEPDTHYRLSFSAYSSTGNDISVHLIQHFSPYTSFMPYYIADLGTNWQTFITEFDTTGLADNMNNGRLMFFLSSFAKGGDTYYIDNVRLENI